MKKTVLLVIALLAFSLGQVAVADERMNGGFITHEGDESGGFKGPSSLAVITVDEAKKRSDNEYVALRGHIVQSLGDEEYQFQDSTGIITIEIEHKRWQGQVITPDDLIEIHGKIDRDWRSIEMDVKRLFKVNKTPE